ncbi:ASCH domain-containing protein [Clostridium taeniosporum]|uniref:ASCH domain-containing protein n=1 Tax=Clostridium taeniosporum TaxID=394958 RepID=A0A1D7XIF7_9CLOT|nr:ASCH domain-containing protein [Clostridium taeniosporum]AOR23121.1 ASCH domain-containing protein [Clostridium taeniosporum]
MSNEHSSVKKMWRDYLNLIGEDEGITNLKYNLWSFGDNEILANELVELVIKGEKTATTSLYYLYEVENEELPKKGQLNIITDFHGSAKCITKTKSVNVLPFCGVKAEFAFKEGEGDKSLEYWKTGHIDFFNRSLQKYTKEFSEDMMVVCEEFEVIYN